METKNGQKGQRLLLYWAVMKGVDISVYNIVKQCVSLLYLRELRAERFQSQLLYLFSSRRRYMMSCLLLWGYPVHVTYTIHVQTNNYLVSTLLWAEPSITTFSKGWTTPTKAGSFRLSAGPGRMQYYLAIGLTIGGLWAQKCTQFTQRFKCIFWCFRKGSVSVSNRWVGSLQVEFPLICI